MSDTWHKLGINNKIRNGGASFLGGPLIRVVLDIDREPSEVVTVYRTSKIEKYWRNEK